MVGKILKIIFLIIVVILIFLGARYLYIKFTFSRPFTVVDMTIQEALKNETRSNYLVTEEEWHILSNESTFRYI